VALDHLARQLQVSRHLCHRGGPRAVGEQVQGVHVGVLLAQRAQQHAQPSVERRPRRHPIGRVAEAQEKPVAGLLALRGGRRFGGRRLFRGQRPQLAGHRPQRRRALLHEDAVGIAALGKVHRGAADAASRQRRGEALGGLASGGVAVQAEADLAHGVATEQRIEVDGDALHAEQAGDRRAARPPHRDGVEHALGDKDLARELERLPVQHAALTARQIEVAHLRLGVDLAPIQADHPKVWVLERDDHAAGEELAPGAGDDAQPQQRLAHFALGGQRRQQLAGGRADVERLPDLGAVQAAERQVFLGLAALLQALGVELDHAAQQLGTGEAAGQGVLVLRGRLRVRRRSCRLPLARPRTQPLQRLGEGQALAQLDEREGVPAALAGEAVVHSWRSLFTTAKHRCRRGRGSGRRGSGPGGAGGRHAPG